MNSIAESGLSQVILPLCTIAFLVWLICKWVHFSDKAMEQNDFREQRTNVNPGRRLK